MCQGATRSHEHFPGLPRECSGPGNEASSTAFTGALSGNRTRSGTAGSLTSVHMGCWHCRRCCNLMNHSTSPNSLNCMKSCMFNVLSYTSYSDHYICLELSYPCNSQISVVIFISSCSRKSVTLTVLFSPTENVLQFSNLWGNFMVKLFLVDS